MEGQIQAIFMNALRQCKQEMHMESPDESLTAKMLRNDSGFEALAEKLFQHRKSICPALAVVGCSRDCPSPKRPVATLCRLSEGTAVYYAVVPCSVAPNYYLVSRKPCVAPLLS